MQNNNIDSKNKNVWLFQKGSKHWNWKGGRTYHTSGYVLIYCPEHPRAKCNNGHVFEHILVMEKHLGRYLLEGEIIHHKNEIRDDNRIENLEMTNRIEHIKHHHTDKHIDTSDRQCHNCGSKTTAIHKADKSRKTPYPHWRHLPWDKSHWYCGRCYHKERRKYSNIQWW